MVHTNTSMFRISTTFKKLCSRCCRIFDSFVYFVEISPSPHDWQDLVLWMLTSLKQFHERMTNPVPSLAGFILSNPAKSGTGQIYKTWIRYIPIKCCISALKHERISNSNYGIFLSTGHNTGVYHACCGTLSFLLIYGVSLFLTLCLHDWPCRNFHLNGECEAGENCKFSHEELTDETRPLLHVVRPSRYIVCWSN